MDKRSILFVLSLMLSLFFVNTYFERKNQDTLREWTQQQKTKKAEKQASLESEIASQTVKASELPIVALYSDVECKNYLTSGVKTEGAVITLAWESSIPQTVYSKNLGGSDAPQLLQKQSIENEIGQPVLFQDDKKSPLRIAVLPDFGRFYLQLFAPISNDPAQPSKITLGEYVDGHLSIPSEQLVVLKNELKEANADKESTYGTEPVTTIPAVQMHSGIALLKVNNHYLPVAFYDAGAKRIIDLSDISSLETIVVKPDAKSSVASGKKVEEKFYVLETPYQQLVFSNYGGALVEINLPFSSETNKDSVVKEIEFDREMVKKHPYNAPFSDYSYYTPGNSESEPLKEHPKGSLGGYYPLLRRNLIGAGPQKSIRVPPRYYALNIVSEYPEVAELVYEVKQFDKDKIVFEAQQNHRRIVKTFFIDNKTAKAPYCFNVTVNVEGDSRGLWLTSGVPEVEWISGNLAPSLKYRMTRNQKPSVENIDLPQDASTVSSVYPDWICNSNGFLGFILDPLTEIDPGYRVQFVPGTAAPSRLVEMDTDQTRFEAHNLPGYMALLPLKTTGGSMNFRVFAGPFADNVLKTVDSTYSDSKTGYNPDYIASQSFLGWFSFISEPFADFLFILMKFFYYITGSWAFSIVLLTAALRLMMYPLNAWSAKSMIRMQQIGPDVAAIQEKYKKDPKKVQTEIMALYRERGVNPVSGCLPMLIQMPFLIGMFDLLKTTFELRGASFIPGWIDDLSAPDVLFSWGTPIFFIGNQFHLLPILLGATMFFQQKLMSTQPSDPSQLTDQQRQQKMMGTMMTVVFTFMFYNFPSGLNIYWLSSTILGFIQQWWTTKRMKKQVSNNKGVVVKK